MKPLYQSFHPPTNRHIMCPRHNGDTTHGRKASILPSRFHKHKKVCRIPRPLDTSSRFHKHKKCVGSPVPSTHVPLTHQTFTIVKYALSTLYNPGKKFIICHILPPLRPNSGISLSLAFMLLTSSNQTTCCIPSGFV